MTLDSCWRLGGQVTDLKVAPPASAAEVQDVEVQLGMPLPPTLSRVVREITSGVSFLWFLPKGWRPPSGVPDVRSGGMVWSLALFVPATRSVRRWRDELVQSAPDFGRTWDGKLGVQEAGNGDVLAVDAATESVVYLLHDPCDGVLPLTLGANFFEFLDQWSTLGCPGPDYDALAPFAGAIGRNSRWPALGSIGNLEEPTERAVGDALEVDGSAGRAWRKYFLPDLPDS